LAEPDLSKQKAKRAAAAFVPMGILHIKQSGVKKNDSTALV
jgi:hypothetical protein